MRLAKGVLLASVLALSTVLTACGDDDKVNAEIEALKAQNAQLQSEIEIGTIYENQIKTSLREVEGANRLEFQTINDKIVFPNHLEVNYTSADVSASKIQIGSSFAFSPSNNWVVKTTGSQIDLNHPSQVWGSIKSVRYDGDTMQLDQMRGTLQDFYIGFPETTVSYRNIFMSDYQRGLLSSATITVDKKPYMVNAGFLTYGDKGVLFLFAFEDNKTGVQQELIDVLIRSGEYGGETIKLE